MRSHKALLLFAVPSTSQKRRPQESHPCLARISSATSMPSGQTSKPRARWRPGPLLSNNFMSVPDIHRRLDLIFSKHPSPADVTRLKIEVCRNHHLDSVPRNSALLAAALPHERSVLRTLLLVKPTRTLSGVAPVAVMTSPAPCPHGKCLPCPGGPEHPYASPQSYTGEEPAALRAREHGYDPFAQVTARLGRFGPRPPRRQG